MNEYEEEQELQPSWLNSSDFPSPIGRVASQAPVVTSQYYT